jgi:hypothetical protein
MVDWQDPNQLLALDRTGYTVLEALTTAPLPPSATYSRPNAFVGIDGNTYWVKGNVQQGLVSELIAGRLAVRIGAGPAARIIRVTPEAAPPDGSANHLLGVVVGSEDQPDTVNARDLAPLASSGQFHPGLVEPESRARVIVFQTWLGVGDSQVLVSVTDGKVLSIDHGDCFGTLTSPAEPPMSVVTDIPGVSPDVGREADHVLAAVARVEAVTDNDLLRAIAQVPGGDAWQSPSDRRLSIGRWLAERRDMLRGVMQSWMQP